MLLATLSFQLLELGWPFSALDCTNARMAKHRPVYTGSIGYSGMDMETLTIVVAGFLRASHDTQSLMLIVIARHESRI
jgi:hypothetical protein